MLSLKMAGTTRLELATSAVTVQRPGVTSCNFTAPIAAPGALRNPRELLLQPNCTQILVKFFFLLYYLTFNATQYTVGL